MLVPIVSEHDVTQVGGVAPITQEATVNGYKGNTITFKILEASLQISTHSKHSNYIKPCLSYSRNMHHIEVTHILLLLI